MKEIMFISSVLSLLILSCTSDKLDRKTALQILQNQKGYPKIIEEEIYTGDPEDAKRVLNAGLEKLGLVVVQRTQKLENVGEPLISFTDKAKSYLLPASDEDRNSNVQKVKIAEEVIEEVSLVQMQDDEKKAVVEYKTFYKNITPFSVLSNLKLNEKNLNKAYFSLYDDGWRLEEK